MNWIKAKTLKSDIFKDESFDILLDLAWYDLRQLQFVKSYNLTGS